MVRLTEHQGRHLVAALGEVEARAPGTLGAIGFGDLLKLITAQLNSPEHSGDLIDVVAKALSNTSFSGGMSRAQVEALRNAILSPMELAHYKAMMSKAHSCAGCSKEIAPDELLTASKNGPHCYRCSYPSIISCMSCGEQLSIPGVSKTIDRIVARHVCGQPALSDVDDPRVMEPRSRVARPPSVNSASWRPGRISPPEPGEWIVVDTISNQDGPDG